jgi:hypothetical protein
MRGRRLVCVRTLLASFLVSAPVLACSCVGIADPCAGIIGSTIVFAGRVLIDSGEGWGNRPARVLVEERLLNVPRELVEVEVDSNAGTSCYFRLKAGERYVLYAGTSKSNPKRLRVGPCSGSFAIRGNEHILDALRNKANGGPSRILGKVYKSTGAYSKEDAVGSAVVTARSDEATYQTLTDAFGWYEMLGVAPGDYHLSASKEGYLPDFEFNMRSAGGRINLETKSVETDRRKLSAVSVREASCAVRDLSMWANGRISGKVTNQAGTSLTGVTVQAFSFDKRGERESRPIQTATTDGEGRYLIQPLPAGDYVVGVNFEKYRDADPYPPTFYHGGGSSSEPVRVHVQESEGVDAIDLVLPPKRDETVLRVVVVGPNGSPHLGATVTLENLAGQQRWYSRESKHVDGVTEIPVYVGEKYVVNAFSFKPFQDLDRASYYLNGSTRIDVTQERPSVVVVLRPKPYRE